ncbi:MAG: rhamnogalacturonan lyase [Ruminococcus sp.]|nr:rhamnogalacturonan lyase [Ruminococcus sp.]
MTEFAQLAINLSNANSSQSGAYFDIPLDVPDDLTMPDGTTCSYSPNDASVGNVDGDGDYEIILKWDPSNSQDNSKDRYTGNVYLDCYEMDGTKLWRIDLGINIRAGAHYTQFMVYDYDGDGYAEIVCKTADGTVDGTGTVIGDASADYRSSAGRILSGPEYLTLFEGATGKALDTIDYNPGRGDVSAWGDSYGNRVDRFTAATAYLDGTTPSVVMCRGYYTRMTATAYDVVDKKLVERWAFDTGNNSAAAGYGDGNHNCMAADVDEDGKDELVMGSAVIDDDGSLLYTTGLGHGDALHVGDFIPDNPGLEIFMCHEEGKSGYGISLRDAATGEILFRETASSDTGRCIADNLIPSNNSAEFSGSHNEIVYDSTGTQICTWDDITKWGQNSVVYWTGTLERCVLDRTMVDQYGYGRVFTGDGVTYNNSSKLNACITCDLFGDWREEMVFPTSDGTALRVFGTTYTTEYAIYTLMHNVQYREQVSGQNVAYNQPPHTDYFLETGSPLPEFPDVYAAAAE